jgi:phosphatidylglycerol:prolipoprotein diacylglycerol transferase
MLPFLVLGPLKIPTYGLMMATAFVVASVLIEQEFRRRGMGKNLGWDSVAVALIAGVIGSRINYLLEHPAEFAGAPLKAAFSGSGLTWYGGFVLALAALLVFWRVRKVRLLPAMDTLAIVVPLAIAIGRIGCQLSGDGDYGRPTNVPWAMSYPNGVAPTTELVHPTPVYEIVLMTAFFFVLWRLRLRKLPNGFIFALYLLGYGLERFFIEFLRTNKPVFIGLTEAQLVSIGLVLAGGLVMARLRRPRPVAAA